uniref:Uncharacterized protein n=1 Tax=Kalanchoe fedtschenkoi TaxID=63787 RepID=A0A7N0VMR9_KALFE
MIIISYICEIFHLILCGNIFVLTISLTTQCNTFNIVFTIHGECDVETCKIKLSTLTIVLTMMNQLFYM